MSVMYRVKNRGASLVVYKIPEDGIRREFKPGQTLPISSEELEKLTYQPGGITILTQFLQIMEPEAIEKYHIKAEPEYFMSEADVAKLIAEGSLDAFLDALDFAPAGILDLIKKLSLSIPMTDMKKKQALKEKTGFDVDAALKNQQLDKEDEPTPILKSTGERRVKAEEVPAGRRTAPPKYNVISMKTE